MEGKVEGAVMRALASHLRQEVFGSIDERRGGYEDVCSQRKGLGWRENSSLARGAGIYDVLQYNGWELHGTRCYHCAGDKHSPKQRRGGA